MILPSSKDYRMNVTSPMAARRTAISRCGAVAWIVGAAQFFLAHLIVQSAWKNPSYSWSRNNVSDLGNIHCGPWGDNARQVCSPLHNLMNGAIVIEGAMLVVGLIAVSSLWRGTITSRIARTFLVVAGLAIILVGLVPADRDENLHVLGALLITFFGNVGLILTGLVARREGVKTPRILAISIGVIGALATGLFFSGNYLGLGMGGMERFAVFGMQIWSFITGFYLLVRPPLNPHGASRPPELASSRLGSRPR
jgi:hypothetical membrane protein